MAFKIRVKTMAYYMVRKIMPNNLEHVNQGDRQLCLLAPHPLHHTDEKGQGDCQLQVRACSVVYFEF